MKPVDFDQNPELSLWPMVVSNVPFNTIEKLVWVFLPLKSDLSNIYKESSEYVMIIQSIRRSRVVFLNTNICMSLFCLKQKMIFSQKSISYIRQVLHRAQKAQLTQMYFIQIKMHWTRQEAIFALQIIKTSWESLYSSSALRGKKSQSEKMNVLYLNTIVI